MDKIAIIIGSNTDITLGQVKYLKDHLIFGELNLDDNYKIKLFHLPGANFVQSTDKNFIESLKEYTILILSGGDTAYSVLHTAEFNYLESGDRILPLISTGTIHGGVFDGKKYIIKGGSLGDDDIYIKLIKHLVINSN